MLISEKEIKKIRKFKESNEIITYFEKWKNRGYNTNELVYLPKELSKKAKKLLSTI